MLIKCRQQRCVGSMLRHQIDQVNKVPLTKNLQRSRIVLRTYHVFAEKFPAEFDDGGLSYYAHSSYAIYTNDGKLFKNIENHISRSDEIPEIVALPVGYYTVEARSESQGYIRVRVIIKAGQRTTIDLDSGEKATPARLSA